MRTGRTQADALDEHLAKAKLQPNEFVQSHALRDDIASSLVGAESEFREHFALNQGDLPARPFGLSV